MLLLSPRTVAYTHAVLRAALNDALRDEVPRLRRNAAKLVRPPLKGPSSARPLVLRAMEVHPLAGVVADPPGARPA